MSKNQWIWIAILMVITLIAAVIVILFHPEKEYLIAAIFFVAVGIGALSLGIWHEFQWWKRFDWKKGQGVIVGFKKRILRRNFLL